MIIKNLKYFLALIVLITSSVSVSHPETDGTAAATPPQSGINSDVKSGLGSLPKNIQDAINKAIQEAMKPKTTRIKEVSGQVVIDGSLKVLEPAYLKNADFVEVSTSITPISNHVRLYAVAVGTYTVLKAQFDNGTVTIITNN